ncbi:4-hydroxythreonine-4-phosphate dehydrogenase PdxA [Flavobacterium agricola]|uniref:4-hydroxythreonine-4-phosphate dehydrogenase PdxA n=1 Tax=Flavobacterium agricola TaxID=2870839 RepID=A0ABY6LXX5_9FLAO|nr:4-hydroxythreonine-4-phosphate dehydrogenase PdxA [Flavobacterium agricola]UYW01189.1 4-hydroxythreonine-4-phosphate dehydrogenase PdxA [Flavobacterium agricola]
MVKKNENIIVGISVGDLNGIGSEVIFKSFEDARMFEFCTPVVFANAKLLMYLRKVLNINVTIHGIDKLEQAVAGKLNVLNVWKEGVNIEFGTIDENVGKYAIKSFTAATDALKEGLVDVLLTAPINKNNIQTEDFTFPGHTDYLNQELEGNSLMLMVNDNLRVGLITDHVAIHQVANDITPELIKAKVKTVHQTLKQDFCIDMPKIAILGLNPHCGDGGVIGNEDDVIIKPTINELFDEGIKVFGPYSADGFFGAGEYENFDAVLAMYHDQGLIPFKTLSFGNGVNYTAGLNKIRTSPDHGTAFAIAGKNVADASSFTAALYLALDVYRNRMDFEALTKNTLTTQNTADK